MEFERVACGDQFPVAAVPQNCRISGGPGLAPGLLKSIKTAQMLLFLPVLVERLVQSFIRTAATFRQT
jgi:hypothetical protein